MRQWRWAVVLGAVALLCSLPVIVANWPVTEPGIEPEALRTLVAGSAAQPFEGLFESRGGLRLPDLGRLDDEVAPFRTSSRVRVWYGGPEQWRADELLVGAERAVYREPGGLWLWDSGRRRIVFSPREVEEPLRIPRLMDFSPAELGRRLVRESDVESISSIPARRVAGRTGAGLRITPTSPSATIDHVDIWADPVTGVVLAVEIDTGGTAPVFETAWVDFRYATPDGDVVTFDPNEIDEPVREAVVVDAVESASATAFALPFPDVLAGLPRRSAPQAALATYGEGLTVVNVLVVPQGGLGRRIAALPRVERPWGGEAALVETSLVNVQIARVGGFDVVLAGTVDVAELDRIAGVVAAAGSVL